jgi:hypothetical protein
MRCRCRTQADPSEIIRALVSVAQPPASAEASDDSEFVATAASIRALAKKVLKDNQLGPIVFLCPELGKWSTVGGECRLPLCMGLRSSPLSCPCSQPAPAIAQASLLLLEIDERLHRVDCH